MKIVATYTQSVQTGNNSYIDKSISCVLQDSVSFSTITLWVREVTGDESLDWQDVIISSLTHG